jgi:hypothetical protein
MMPLCKLPAELQAEIDALLNGNASARTPLRSVEKEQALIELDWEKDFRSVWPEGWDDDQKDIQRN